MTCTEQQFLKDIERHQMEVFRNDGVNRHIRFRVPGTMCEHFDLITWPGYLCYTGDMGSYVFRRLEDMFKFFRTDADSTWLKSKGLTLGINPSYWGGKLEAVDRGDGYKVWSLDKFKLRLRERFDQWAAYALDTPEAIKEAWETVEQDVIYGLDEGGKESAYQSASNCDINGKRPFEDFWEYDTDDYSYRFMWCCYALAWGIKTYDEAVCAPLA